MSSNDLEGDDIWGDSAGGGDEGKEESKQAGGPDPRGQQQEQQEEEPAEVLEDEETRHMSIGELRQRIHLINNDIRVMKSDVQRITHESRGQRDQIRDNQEKVKLNKQLPYLVANVVEVLEPDAEDGKQTSMTTYLNAIVVYFKITNNYLHSFFRLGRRRKRIWRCH